MRPVGNRIKQACEVIEQYGPCGYAVITSETGIERSNASKYCQRAVGLGLMTVQRPEKRWHREAFAIYSVVPGWRDSLVRFKSSKPAEKMEMLRPKGIWSGISSVFNMGAV